MVFPKYLSVNMDPSEGSAASINDDISQLSESQTQHCIYKVHNHLRNINDKAYDPQIIAIGPYHHDKDTFQVTEKHKLRYLKELLRRKEQNVEQYTSVVEELEKRARDCYGEPISLDQADFIKMLVLDGCFIIELLKRWHQNDSYRKKDPIFQMSWIRNSLRRDLILFENQIPFFVLCKLFDLIEGADQHDVLIDLILRFFQGIYPGAEAVPRNRTDIDSREIKHLLHLIHTNWRPSFDTRDNNVSIDRKSGFIHSATQLTDANMSFSKGESKSLFDADYEKGTMVIPPLMVCDYYVMLLDCLVNSSGDVEILSECGIIQNWLGENEVVAGIFNRLQDSVTYSAEQSMYAEMMDRVNQHYRRPWNRAMARLSRDYFNSPWAFLTVASAVVLLLLTVAQTVLSALQLIKS